MAEDNPKGRRRVDVNDTLTDQLEWKPGSVLLAEDVQAAMSTVKELADGIEYPTLIDMTNTQKVTGQGLYSASGALRQNIALLGSSP